MEFNISGRFTFNENKDFKKILDSIASNSSSIAVINLMDLEFIDSAGLGMLLLARDECEKRNVKLILRNPKGQVEKIFRISKFYDLFEVE